MRAETRRPRPASEARSGASADEPEAQRDDDAEESEPQRKGGVFRLDHAATRSGEMHRAILIVGALVLLGLTFYVGVRFPYWKYKVFASRNAPKLEGTVANKFPGVSPDELVRQALELERAGKMQDAAEHLLAAKHKNLDYRGILARVAKIAYESKNFEVADQLFERAIAFGENVGEANYYRGLIAVRRKDLPAARRSFEAAEAAEPFVPEYPFYLAESLRLDHHARESIPLYQRAALLIKSPDQEAICRFKIRMALLEAAEAPKLREEVKAQEAAGQLSVAWLMTAAALHIREGQVDEGVPYILLARDAGEPVIFAACARDAYFIEASHKHPRVAEVCQVVAE